MSVLPIGRRRQPPSVLEDGALPAIAARRFARASFHILLKWNV
jgi:hypothetical protein